MLHLRRRSSSGLFQLLGAIAVASLLTSCASNRQSPFGAGRATPQFLELLEPASRGTLHFPQGLYAFESEDDTGYYYRAPRSVRQHSFGGSYPHDGGVFVRKSSPLHMRGYIHWASKRTKVGNISDVRHEFRD
jgi:hypothetical protein